MIQTAEIITETGFTALVKDYTVYNQWANTTLVRWLRSKPLEVLEKEIPSSFPGIKNTMVHIWDVERGWLAHIRGEVPPTSFRLVPFNGTLEEAIEGLLSTSAAIENFVSDLTENELMEVIHIDIPYVKADMARFEIIHHAMNHSTYHRGQVTCMGHHVGLHDAPMTDYMFYVIRVKGK